MMQSLSFFSNDWIGFAKLVGFFMAIAGAVTAALWRLRSKDLRGTIASNKKDTGVSIANFGERIGAVEERMARFETSLHEIRENQQDTKIEIIGQIHEMGRTLQAGIAAGNINVARLEGALQSLQRAVQNGIT